MITVIVGGSMVAVKAHKEYRAEIGDMVHIQLPKSACHMFDGATGSRIERCLMKGSRPEQAVLSRDTDMSKTDETRRVIEGMVDGLNDHRINDIGDFFSRWLPLDGQYRLRVRMA